MRYGIKEKDIKDFERYAQELDYLIKRIRKYAPNAYIYATPDRLNLMGNINDDTSIATFTFINPLDCGDW